MDTHDNNTTKEYDFASRLSHKIISEHITPRSKFMTILIQILLWIPWLFVTLIGIVGVAGIIFTVAYSGWKYYGAIGIPPFLYAMQTVSVVWIMCLALFSAIAIKAFRITKKGYRVSPFTIITLSLVVSIAGGSLMYIGDRIVAQNQYFRRPIQAKQQQLWANPYKGRMVGTLIWQENAFVFEDTTGFVWKLDVTEVLNDTYQHGSTVRAVGIPLNDETFKVCVFLPLSVGVHSSEKIQKPSSIQLFVSEEKKLSTYELAKGFSCERNFPLRP